MVTFIDSPPALKVPIAHFWLGLPAMWSTLKERGVCESKKDLRIRFAWLLLEFVGRDSTEISRLSANHAERLSASPKVNYLVMGTNTSLPPSVWAWEGTQQRRVQMISESLTNSFITGLCPCKY